MEKNCSDGARRSGRAQPDDARKGHEPAAPSQGRPEQLRLARGGCPLKVLVVEDDMIIATDLVATVEERGGVVIGTASDSRRAIELSLEHYPDVVLMDVILRGQSDGVHAAEVIRDLVGSAIVFCTANNDPQTLRRMEAVDGAVIIQKPVLSLELCQAICTTVRRDMCN